MLQVKKSIGAAATVTTNVHPDVPTWGVNVIAPADVGVPVPVKVTFCGPAVEMNPMLKSSYRLLYW